MPDNPRRAKGSGCAVLALVLLGLVLVLPVAYVLSYGPAYAMINCGQMDVRAYAVVYGPLMWLETQSVTLYDLSITYRSWWSRHWPWPPHPNIRHYPPRTNRVSLSLT
jgi:hypothetical protein